MIHGLDEKMIDLFIVAREWGLYMLLLLLGLENSVMEVCEFSWNVWMKEMVNYSILLTLKVN